MNLNYKLMLSLVLLLNYQLSALDIGKGVNLGCYKQSDHNIRRNLQHIQNCFDYCESQFYRHAILNDPICSCENILKESEEDKTKCNKNCTIGNEVVICGGDDNVESIYGTGSNLPGPVQNLIVNFTTEDKIVLVFDAPERNGTELTEYELRAVVIDTYSTNPWSMRNITRKYPKTQRKIEMSDLIPSTEYNITLIAKNGDQEGGSKSIIGKTRLGKPDIKPEEPKILKYENGKAQIEIQRAINNNGPVSNYVIVVHFVDNELIHDFDESLLTTYQKARDDGLSYYITAEIEPFKTDKKEFVVGDGGRYGKYYNAPLPDNVHFHILVGVVSRHFDEYKVTYSNSSHDESFENLHIHSHTETSSNGPSETIVILLTIACIICGVILVGAIVFYGYIKTKINPRIRRFERHEMSLQGPILEVDNNGYIADVSGINFKEKLQEVLLSLDDDQKIIRKNLSLDIDNILGIGSFGDVIRGQLNSNISCQVHVVSADDMDPPIQTKFIRDLNSLLQFGFHRNMLNFMGICQTHDWFFVVFEDVPVTLKQFLLSNRQQEMNLSNQRVTNLSENDILKLMYELAETMEYLQYNKVVHKNLNSYNVRIKRHNSSYTVKLSVFGPTLYCMGDDGSKNLIDDERWHAPEVLRFQKFSHASDIYSFGLVVWEMCCLGATIYGSVTTNDLLSRIKKGFRPDKHPFISEDLYQLMLNCWELDPLERSEIHDVAGHLKQMQSLAMHYLNFNYDGQLPYFLPLLEIKN
ncbi:putative inactive tyrosine-protein kinase Wsck isoform X1 [Chironomus tepperi]|uniref:putative inactive tyrosine-protein kinase Wsck isoform X1 n=1 Tax=Chironomus tepperi TaxID=113505 RepID=UPI00391F4D4A